MFGVYQCLSWMIQSRPVPTLLILRILFVFQVRNTLFRGNILCLNMHKRKQTVLTFVSYCIVLYRTVNIPYTTFRLRKSVNRTLEFPINSRILLTSYYVCVYFKCVMSLTCLTECRIKYITLLSISDYSILLLFFTLSSWCTHSVM